jgi:hypothetical protein
MIIKSEEWAAFKKEIFNFLSVFESESTKLIFSPLNEYDFSLHVQTCKVFPVFTKKPDFQKVEYDFTNYDEQLENEDTRIKFIFYCIEFLLESFDYYKIVGYVWIIIYNLLIIIF